jgi:hypothetical protein
MWPKLPAASPAHERQGEREAARRKDGREVSPVELLRGVAELGDEGGVALVEEVSLLGGGEAPGSWTPCISLPSSRRNNVYEEIQIAR